MAKVFENTGLVHIVDFDYWRERAALAHKNIERNLQNDLKKYHESALKAYQKKPMFGQGKTDVPPIEVLETYLYGAERMSYDWVKEGLMHKPLMNRLKIIEAVLNTEGTGLVFLSGEQIEFLDRWS